MKYILSAIFSVQFLFSNPELIIGQERVEPGILLIFEGAIKDHIMPLSIHLSENHTHVHIEARINWDNINIPVGAIKGGFIPYLHITAEIINKKTKIQTFIDLLPHINLIDNFHYARNISLPGSIDDFYYVKFNILPPTNIDLALHKDWYDIYGPQLFKKQTFSYDNIYFGEICRSTRN